MKVKTKQTNKQKLYFLTSFLALHWNLIMLNKANSGSNKNDIQHRVCDMFRQNNLSCVFFPIENVQIKSVVYRRFPYSRRKIYKYSHNVLGKFFSNIKFMGISHTHLNCLKSEVTIKHRC